MVRNYREEIETALAGGAPEYVPFSFYDLLYPKGFDPSLLQAKGMAVCARRDVYRKVMPNVKVTEVREQDGGVRTIYTTPIGTLTLCFHWPTAASGIACGPICSTAPMPIRRPSRRRSQSARRATIRCSSR